MAAVVDSFSLLADVLISDLDKFKNKVVNIFGAIGFAYVSLKTVQLGLFLYRNSKSYLSKSSEKLLLYPMPKWAVIYGLDGIAIENLAYKLAQCGFGLVLVDPNSDRSNKLANKLRVATSSEVVIHSPEYIWTTLNVFDDKKVLILVNNLSNPRSSVCTFDKLRSSDYQLCQCEELTDIQSIVNLTSILLPRMIHSEVRTAIINITMDTGCHPTPGCAVFGGQQSFMKHFSNSLREDCRYWGVNIISLSLPISTLWNNEPSPADQKAIAQTLLKSLGNRKSTHGLINYAFQIWYYKMLPKSVFLWWYRRGLDPLLSQHNCL